MSLCEITVKYDPPLEEIKTGYKVFMQNECDQLKFEFYNPGDYFYIPMLEELKANPRPINLGDLSYTSGFHIFKHLQDAKQWASINNPFSDEKLVVAEVEYHHTTITGLQWVAHSSEVYEMYGMYKVDVAQNMTVLRLV